MTIFWDILKWNRGQTQWDGGSSNYHEPTYSLCSNLFVMFEKLNFLKEYHLLSCLSYKNV